jgi:hypothetical protein
MERAAQDAALAEVKKNWSKAADGWITARNSWTSFAPVRFVRKMRELAVEGVRSADLTEAGKMNGLEWVGEVKFKQSPCREAGDQGILLDDLANVTVFRQCGQWTQWVDFQRERIQIQKAKGNWEVPQDTWLLRGNVPTADDFANAGVKVGEVSERVLVRISKVCDGEDAITSTRDGRATRAEKDLKFQSAFRNLRLARPPLHQ